MVNPAEQDEPTSNLSESTDEAGSDTASSSTETGSDRLTAEVNELKSKVTEYKDAYMRAMAESDNVRRRAQVDVQNAHKYGIERLARELLLVIDSLEHALLASTNDPALRQGVELTLKLFVDTLDKFGIQQIDPLGEAFNPN